MLIPHVSESVRVCIW